jgi:tartrate/fumarate subfamily iron-sulfur-dependent hydro-lyase beta chain
MSAREIKIPLKNPDIVRKLSCGDDVLLSGVILTARDAFHKKLCSLRTAPGFLPKGSALYHCGPIASQDESGKWRLIAAGPTTSWRMGTYAPEIIRRFGVRIFVGKGGMGEAFSNACVEFGAVYLSFPGGCAQSARGFLREIRNVYFLDEFGPAEAVFEITVERMPLTVTIDSSGRSLHSEIRKKTESALKKICEINTGD